MTAATADAGIRFYFSFRCPYAWLAAEKLDVELGELGAPIECVPIYPKPELFPNDPSALPAKQACLVQDVPRLAREAGLSVRFPSQTDTDWASAHAAFLGAQRLGGGHAFMSPSIEVEREVANHVREPLPSETFPLTPRRGYARPRQSHLYQIRFTCSMTFSNDMKLPLTPK